MVPMKLDDFAHAVSQAVFHELEHAHHFVVPEKIRKAILEKIRKEHASLVK
jgi:hypothetical protein